MPLRVVVIGCGLVGQRRAEIAHRSPDSHLTVVVDVDENRAKALASRLGCLAMREWQEAIARDDVDVVVVSTTNNWLAPITIDALQRGKHVLVEKPVTRSPAEAEAILQAAYGARPVAQGKAQAARSEGSAGNLHSSAGGQATWAVGGVQRPVLGVGFNHRHHQAIRKAHQLFTQGAIGDIMFIRCRYGHGGRPGYEKEWRADPEVAGGGELLDQGVHAIDLFRWFLGDFVEAFGFTSTWFWDFGFFPTTEDDGQGTARRRIEDNALALFRTATGQIAFLHASCTQWKNLFFLEVFGREGYLNVEGLGGSYGPERLVWGRRRPESGPPQEEQFDFPGPDVSWEAEWQEFLTAIREGREPLANGYDARQAIRMVHAVYQSAQTGRVVRL